MQRFTSWRALASCIYAETGHFPYSGRGIWTINDGVRKIAILRSVVGYRSYKDEFFSHPEGRRCCKYTFEGKIGNQNPGTRGNQYLTTQADHLYLYGVDTKRKVWYWFGRVTRTPDVPIEKLRHRDDSGNERDIYRISLELPTSS